MQQDGFPDWDYQGLQLLEEGDDFTVYTDDDKTLWQSIIHRDTVTGLASRQVSCDTLTKTLRAADKNWSISFEVIGVDRTIVPRGSTRMDSVSIPC